jgi:hypothetical protein
MYELTLNFENSRRVVITSARLRHGRQKVYTHDRPSHRKQTRMGRNIRKRNRGRLNHDCYNVSAVHGDETEYRG